MRPVAILAVCAFLLNHRVAAGTTEQYGTYVPPNSTETMQGPCEYELTLRDASKPVKAVFVIVERGWQVGNLYFDPEVTAFAERHDLALVGAAVPGTSSQSTGLAWRFCRASNNLRHSHTILNWPGASSFYSAFPVVAQWWRGWSLTLLSACLPQSNMRLVTANQLASTL